MRKWSFLDRWSLRILGVLLWLASGVVFMFGIALLRGTLDSTIFWFLVLIFGIPIILSIGAGIVGFYYGWRVFLSADDTE
ncbi:MAG: hypothetical protein HRT81_02550 [Henriciella sp.]|nr:hypothetical protein [Henriciella sp.]